MLNANHVCSVRQRTDMRIKMASLNLFDHLTAPLISGNTYCAIINAMSLVSRPLNIPVRLQHIIQA